MPCFLFLLLLSLARTDPPALLSATQYIQNVHLQGADRQYGIFEMEWDQEIYYTENWADPCVSNTTAICPASRIPSGSVNESGVTVYDLSANKDEWFDYFLPYSNVTTFKFYLDPNKYPEGCPTIRISMQTLVGQGLVSIANNAVPSAANYQYQRIPWATSPGMWISPVEAAWSWGWWYFSVQNRPPVVDYVQYRVKWGTHIAPSCPEPPPVELVLPTANDTWILLRESQPAYGSAGNDFQTAHFYVKTQCTNFSIQIRNANVSEFGDLDVYLSRFHQNPRINDQYEWAGHLDGPDTLTIWNICSLNGSTPWPIYVGFYNWASESTHYMIVATTQNMGIRMPLSEETPGQIDKIGANGAVKLICPNEQHFYCWFPSYLSCTDPFTKFYCCTPFALESPFAEPFPPLIPRIGIAEDLYLFPLPWNVTTKRNQTANVPRKLVYSLLLSITDGDNFRRFYPYTNVTGCYMTFNHVWTNVNGTPIETNVSFTPKYGTCNESSILDVYYDIGNLTAQMEGTVDYGAVRVYEYQAAEKMAVSDVYYCQELVDSFVHYETENELFLNQQSCYQIPFESLYNQDACCSSFAKYYNCCFATDVTTTYDAATYVKDALVEEETVNPTCSNRALTRYIEELTAFQDPNGCQKRWLDKASPTVIDELSRFIQECREELLGTGSLLGIPCTSDSNCSTGKTCNKTTLKCNHDDETVIDCFVERIDPTVSASLFNLWQIPVPVTSARLKSEMTDKFIGPTCRGPASIQYQDSWWYSREIVGCDDACDSNEPRCFEQETCYIDTFPCLQLTIGAEFCWRTWFTVQANNVACVAEQTCNWMDCGNRTTAQCGTDCLALSNVCLDCTGERCISVPSRNQTTCVFGCTAGDIDDPTTCVNSGTCSLNCPSCTKVACEALGTCVGQSNFEDLMVSIGGVGGVCFSDYNVDPIEGTISCPSDKTSSTWGCASNVSQASCLSPNVWISSFTATDRNSCESVATGCWNSVLKIFMLSRDNALCSCDSDLSWSPFFRWNPAVYTPGVVYDLVWAPTQMQSVRTVIDSILYRTVHDTVQEAIIAISSIVYSSDVICRYGNLLNTQTHLSCDLINSSLTHCFDETDSVLVLKVRGCPFIRNEITDPAFNLTILETSFPPDDYCQQIAISQSSIDQFTQTADHSLTSEVFAKRAPNKWSVVTNYQETGIIVGQIVTDMIIVNWNISVQILDGLWLCIPIVIDVTIAPSYTRYAFAQPDPNTRIIRPLDYATFTENGSICANISEPGSYIGAVLVEDDFAGYRGDYDSLAAQYIVAAVIYGLLFLWSLYLQALIFYYRKHRWAIKATFCFFVNLFNLCRCLFFAIPPGTITSPSFHETLFEFPTFLFLMIYTCILYTWSELAFKTASVRARKTSATTNSLIVFWGLWGLMVFLAFLAFLIAGKTIPEVVLLPCESKVVVPASPQFLQVQTAYLSFLAAMSILLAAMLLVAGLAFLVPQRKFLFAKDKQTMDLTRFARMTLLVMICFSCFFIVKSVLFWAHSFSRDGSLVVPVMVFCILEAIPIAVFLYYLHPRNKSTRASSSTRSRTDSMNSRGKQGSETGDQDILKMKSSWTGGRLLHSGLNRVRAAAESISELGQSQKKNEMKSSGKGNLAQSQTDNPAKDSTRSGSVHVEVDDPEPQATAPAAGKPRITLGDV